MNRTSDGGVQGERHQTGLGEGNVRPPVLAGQGVARALDTAAPEIVTPTPWYCVVRVVPSGYSSNVSVVVVASALGAAPSPIKKDNRPNTESRYLRTAVLLGSGFFVV
ncbi:hypothetical protein ACFS07_06470 [Undibacterium arcticum]